MDLALYFGFVVGLGQAVGLALAVAAAVWTGKGENGVPEPVGWAVLAFGGSLGVGVGLG